MPIHLIPEEQIEAAQRELAGQLLDRDVEWKNFAVLGKLDTQVLPFRSRVFEVQPVGFREGMKLQQLENRLRSLVKRVESWNKEYQKADTTESRRVQLDEQITAGTIELQSIWADAVALFWTLVRPATRWGRLWWRWRGNPFGNATEQEIAELFRFFSACRTRSGVRPSLTSTERRSRST